MATASPTPMGSSHFGSLSRRPASRQAYRQPVTRPQPKVEPAPAQRHASSYSMDSSDDEIPVPMVFSAITNAILNDGGPADDAPKYSRKSVSPVENNRARRAGSASLYQGRESPIENKIHSSHPRRRVVRLSSTPVGSHRSGSISDLADDKNEVPVDVKAESPLDLNTPAPVKRTVRITSIAHGSHGSSRSSIDKGSSRTSSDARREREGSAPQDYPSTVSRTQLATSQGSVSRYNPSTIGRRRGVEEVGLQSSMRNRAEIGGMFAHKPMRRMRRRLDDEEQSPVDGEGDALNAAGSSQESQNQGSQESEPQSQEAQSSQDSKVQRPSLYSSSYRDFGNGSPIGGSNDILNSVLRSRSPPPPALKSAASLSQEPENRRPPLLPHHNDHQPVFKLPAPRPDLPSSHDQENEAPPTFKRNKDPAVYLDKLEKASIRPESVDVVVERATISPVRQPLAVRSQNTPRRPAPPPPKMSLLDAATRPAGAATASNASKSRNRVRVNGKYFTRLDCVGRGGSARVYRVMAENSTFYALKKVNLEDADEVAVQGFKGEINLLEKLKGEERVIRLYDYEMNDEKGILSVLMELGDLDMKKVLDIRNKNEHPRFDPTFVRYYWKEMLECIQAIHNHDVVHSDLKPANFVVVKGRLKLIDFGIANAIQTDETVNVHRENQIGTPNYMSPESLIDYNAKPDSRGRMSGSATKLMKLGKPSDIWSLGCILYQLTYGRPPFDHIPNPLPRCQAIINFNYQIHYPAVGVGSVPVPAGLIKTMKKCLERDQFKRPTATELLSDNDPFLNPIDFDDSALPITEELLGRIFMSVAAQMKKTTPTENELLRVWPQGYFDKLRKNLAEGKGM